MGCCQSQKGILFFHQDTLSNEIKAIIADIQIIFNLIKDNITTKNHELESVLLFLRKMYHSIRNSLSMGSEILKISLIILRDIRSKLQDLKNTVERNYNSVSLKNNKEFLEELIQKMMQISNKFKEAHYPSFSIFFPVFDDERNVLSSDFSIGLQGLIIKMEQLQKDVNRNTDNFNLIMPSFFWQKNFGNEIFIEWAIFIEKFENLILQTEKIVLSDEETKIIKEEVQEDGKVVREKYGEFHNKLWMNWRI